MSTVFRTKRRNRKFRNKERLATRHKYGETFQSGGVRGLDNFLEGIPDADAYLHVELRNIAAASVWKKVIEETVQLRIHVDETRHMAHTKRK